MPEPVAEAQTSWLQSLKPKDLLRLREVVKKIHMRHYPEELFTDKEADRIIESLGPKVMEARSRQVFQEEMAGTRFSRVTKTDMRRGNYGVRKRR